MRYRDIFFVEVFAELHRAQSTVLTTPRRFNASVVTTGVLHRWPIGTTKVGVS